MVAVQKAVGDSVNWETRVRCLGNKAERWTARESP